MSGDVTCPKCGAACAHDWSEVDIGVGVETFDHVYTCPEHGEFAYVFDPENPRALSRLVWRNEE